MTDKEFKEYLAKMETFKKELSTNENAAKEFLIAAGIWNEKGHFRKPFRNLRAALQQSLDEK
jgi:predicted negative regulator of RcsB-dependent stress response